MGEEFQESEVIFRGTVVNEEADHLKNSRVSRKNNPKRKKETNSLPVNIRKNVSGNSWFRCSQNDFFDFEDDNEGELVPPHVMVERRVFSEKMAFSVCTGNGRTLKGRDLSEVRNSILKMTGFLET